jgi:hypothetical protein
VIRVSYRDTRVNQVQRAECEQVTHEFSFLASPDGIVIPP